jgi:hypothetical protein
MDHYYFDICFSKFNEKDKNDNAYLEIHFAGDVPTDNDIQEYINKQYPFLSNQKALMKLRPEGWYSDWNCGKPKGCFGIIFWVY